MKQNTLDANQYESHDSRSWLPAWVQTPHPLLDSWVTQGKILLVTKYQLPKGIMESNRI